MPRISCGRPSTFTVCPTSGCPPKAVCHNSVRENRERWRQAPGTIGFFLAEEASLRRLNAKRVEQMGVDRYRPHAQRSIACREVDFAGCVGPTHGSVRPDRRKRLIDLPELQVLLHREWVPGQSERRKLRGQIHQLFRFGIVERTQDHAVDDREDGRIGADSQCQRQERDRREHGSAPKRAQPMAARRASGRRATASLADRGARPWLAKRLRPRVRAARAASAGFETTTSRVFCGHFQVRPELVFQLGVAPALKQRSLKTVNPFAKNAHAISRPHASPCSSVWMMPAIRSHACFSRAS